MKISIASVLTASLLVSIMLLGMCLLFKGTHIMRKVGPKLVIGCMLIVVIRMFFPIELSFIRIIFIEDWFMLIKRGLRYILYNGKFIVRGYDIALLLWIGGAAVGLCRKIYRYKKLLRCISVLPEYSWEEIKKDYQFDYTEYPECEKVKLVRYHGYSTPYLVGYKKIYIVLPQMEYSKEQIHYILLHELMHVRNRDSFWKVIIDVLCTMFWWNPIFRYVKKELFSMIEMRNDQEIAAMVSEEEKLAYMQTLADTAVQLVGKDIAFGLTFSGGSMKLLKKRVVLLADRGKTSRLAQTVLVIVLAGLLVGSFAIIIDPYSFEGGEAEEKGVWLTEENTILIKNGEEYDVYVDGEYLFTTDNLVPFRGAIKVKIYDSLEEYEEELK